MNNNKIDTKLLDTLAAPEKSNIVVYDQNRRTAFFFFKGNGYYRLKQYRGKRGKPINVRAGDILATIDASGRIRPGDICGVFAVQETAYEEA